METRRLGNTELQVSQLCFGGNVFGWTADEQTSFGLLDRFAAAGGNFIDTADVYSKWVPGNSGGESETIIGRWLKRAKKRGEMVIATKVGSEMGPDQKGLSKRYIMKAVENSLKRLQTDVIDLYFAHWDDMETPQEETLDAFTDLIKQGKVRAIGESNFSAQRLSSALKLSREQAYASYQCVQTLYNLYDRDAYEKEIESVCERNQMGVVTYFSLASGFLTGKYRSQADLAISPRGQRVKEYLDERGFRILRALDEVARELSGTPAQVSLAWLMARPSVTAPIASATSVGQLDDLIRATELKLNREALDKLDKASAYTGGRQSVA